MLAKTCRWTQVKWRISWQTAQVKPADVLRAYHEASDACVLGDMEACDRMGNLQHKLDQLDGWAFRNESQFYFK